MFALATFVLPVFAFFAMVDPALLFVLRGGLRLRDAFVFVVLGRELRKAPRTSSSGPCALTISRPQVESDDRQQDDEISRSHLQFLRLKYRSHLCSTRTMNMTGVPSAFCGTLTETNGDAPVLMTSAPTEFALDCARKPSSCFCSS